MNPAGYIPQIHMACPFCCVSLEAIRDGLDEDGVPGRWAEPCGCSLTVAEFTALRDVLQTWQASVEFHGVRARVGAQVEGPFVVGYRGTAMLTTPMLVFGPPSARVLALDEMLDGEPVDVAKVWGVPRWRVTAWKWILRVQAWRLRLRAWWRA